MSMIRRLCLLAAVALLLAAVGCGGNKSGDESTNNPPAGGGGDTYKLTGDEGTISGKINFTGDAPKAKSIDMSNDAYCASKHPGGATADTVVVNDGKLQDVLVYIKSDGLGDKKF